MWGGSGVRNDNDIGAAIGWKSSEGLPRADAQRGAGFNPVALIGLLGEIEIELAGQFFDAREPGWNQETDVQQWRTAGVFARTEAAGAERDFFGLAPQHPAEVRGRLVEPQLHIRDHGGR